MGADARLPRASLATEAVAGAAAFFARRGIQSREDRRIDARRRQTKLPILVLQQSCPTTADDLLARTKIHKLLTMLYGVWLRNNVATLLYDTYADEVSKQQNVAVATADCLAWQKVEARLPQ